MGMEKAALCVLVAVPEKSWLTAHSLKHLNTQTPKHKIFYQMKNLPRILFFLAAASLLMLFVFPMWQITLIAPQYPHGVTMYIWINKITGSEPGTLQNINILNHYVGMKFIEPDSFAELKYFPIIVIVMSLLGMALAWKANRKWWVAWLLAGVVLCALGLYDFYLWEYDYGHNLSPTAPIKVPGMAYQPPLIGNKILLNFLAKSWPYVGGWFVGLTFVLGFLAVLFQKKTHLKNEEVLAGGRDGLSGKRLLSDSPTH